MSWKFNLVLKKKIRLKMMRILIKKVKTRLEIKIKRIVVRMALIKRSMESVFVTLTIVASYAPTKRALSRKRRVIQVVP